MAEKQVYIGSFGPFLYDDADHYAVESDGSALFEGDMEVKGDLIVDSIGLADTNDSNHLSLVWNEDDTVDRVLNLLVGGGTRSLTIEADSVINQDLTSDASPTFADLTLSTPVNIYALSHDSFTGFVADEHIAHTGVSIIAGTGMSGGGNISASRTLNCSITQYTDELAQDAVGGILDNGIVGNIVFTYDDVANAISAVTQDGEIDHDALLNFVAAEHLSLPNTIASVLSDHNKAAHDALNIDADTWDSYQFADYLNQAVKTGSSPTFAGITIANGGTIGQAAGPLLTFDDTNNYLEITGCDVGIGTATPSALLNLKGTLSSALTGTVAVTNLSTAVVGTGTLFTTELAVGDSIKIGTEVFTVSAITDALNLTLDSAYQGATTSGLTAYRDPTLLAIDNGDAVNKLTITRSGNVGIGTTDPGAYKLNVNGNFGFGATLASLTGDTLPAWTGGFEINNEAGVGPHIRGLSIQFDTGPSTGSPAHPTSVGALALAADGNVGIGTTPGYKLAVAGSAQIMGGGIDSTLGDSIIFSNTSYQSSYFNKIRNAHSGTPAQSYMTFELSTGAATTLEVLRLQGNGNVTIASLAGAGSRTVVADANGVLSAP